MDANLALQDFGLTEKQVNLYLALLKSGESTASDLAKATNTNRSFTYDRLKKLTELGLVSYVIKDNKKYFIPAKPSQLLAILKEREAKIKSILPQLESISIDAKDKPIVEIYTSKK